MKKYRTARLLERGHRLGVLHGRSLGVHECNQQRCQVGQVEHELLDVRHQVGEQPAGALFPVAGAAVQHAGRRPIEARPRGEGLLLAVAGGRPRPLPDDLRQLTPPKRPAVLLLPDPVREGLAQPGQSIRQGGARGRAGVPPGLLQPAQYRHELPLLLRAGREGLQPGDGGEEVTLGVVLGPRIDWHGKPFGGHPDQSLDSGPDASPRFQGVGHVGRAVEHGVQLLQWARHAGRLLQERLDLPVDLLLRVARPLKVFAGFLEEAVECGPAGGKHALHRLRPAAGLSELLPGVPEVSERPQPVGAHGGEGVGGEGALGQPGGVDARAGRTVKGHRATLATSLPGTASAAGVSGIRP
ncbi:hypothetical protein [Kitasatospora sp. NPDC056789]|uniref:hypothetical protein n=1 Tax=Kitasatospora sp. NPDC056789 TaxID=3345945 RepID=UPI001300ED00